MILWILLRCWLHRLWPGGISWADPDINLNQVVISTNQQLMDCWNHPGLSWCHPVHVIHFFASHWSEASSNFLRQIFTNWSELPRAHIYSHNSAIETGGKHLGVGSARMRTLVTLSFCLVQSHLQNDGYQNASAKTIRTTLAHKNCRDLLIKTSSPESPEFSVLRLHPPSDLQSDRTWHVMVAEGSTSCEGYDCR